MCLAFEILFSPSEGKQIDVDQEEMRNSKQKIREVKEAELSLKTQP